MKKLLNNFALEQSSIVANSLMNRERRCLGGNSYEKELSFNIIEFLRRRIGSEKQVRWLDLCCGEGKAGANYTGQAVVNSYYNFSAH